MNPVAEKLWVSLLAALRGEGRLPERWAWLTPLELGELFADRTGDDRVRVFVRDYYYPHHFGQVRARLTDTEAEKLVNSFGEAPRADATFRDLPPLPGEAPCHVCSKRPARRGEGEGA